MATKSKSSNKTAENTRVDEGTGLESLAVDRESSTAIANTEGKVETDTNTPAGHLNGVTVNDDGERVPPIEGVEIIGRAESGEPIIAGGVPMQTTGPGAHGTQDPDLGVALASDTALARHEADRDNWGALDAEASDGSPADRNKVLHGANKKETKQLSKADPRQTVENERNQPDA